MADQRGEEIDHHPRDAAHLHQQAQHDEHRHRQQQQVGDAVVDPVDDDDERQVGGQREIGEGGDAEGEGDRHPDHHVSGDEHDKEQDQAGMPHRDQQRLRQPQCQRDAAHQCDSNQEPARSCRFEQAQQCDDGGQGGAD